jgi:hypothetical protein
LQSEDAITDASATLSETLEFEGRNSPAFDFLDNVSVTPAGMPNGGSTVSFGIIYLTQVFHRLFWSRD